MSMADESARDSEGDPTDNEDLAPGDESVTTIVVVHAERLPAERRGGALARGVRNLPAPVVKTAAAVAAGVVVQASVALAGKYFSAQAGQKSAKALAANSRGGRKRRASQDDDGPDGGTTVTETLIVRRVFYRRGD